MKIITQENGENKKFNKTKIAIASLVVITVVVAIAIAFSVFGKSDEVPQTTNSKSAIEDQVSPEVYKIETKTVQAVNEYTTIQTDKKSLVKLVKSTIVGYKKEIESVLSQNNPTTDALFDSTIQAVRNKVNINMIKPTTDPAFNGWTYSDYAGMVGNYIFDKPSYGSFLNAPFQKSDLLKNFVTCDVFDVNVDKTTNWSLAGKGSNQVGGFDVNYQLKFVYNGQTYKTFIGNQDGKYKVLDIVKGNKVTVITATAANATSVKPSPTPRHVKRSVKTPANNTNAPTGLEPKTPPKKKPVVDSHPVKPGYVYDPAFGYIKDEGENGTAAPKEDGMTNDKLSGVHSGNM